MTLPSSIPQNRSDPSCRRKRLSPTRKNSGWEVVEDAGRGFRRVVPSPIPREIIELDVIRLLVEKGYIVIAAGGGGIPVIRNEQGEIEGVEAVIDKDLASSLLARNLGADTFIISTAVDAVYLNFGKENQRPIRQATLPEMKRYLGGRPFQARIDEAKNRVHYPVS